MKISIILFVFLVANILETPAAPANTYDQRQSGEYNFRLGLKNIEIIVPLDSGLFEDYDGDYDISYEYTDFTLKPPKPPATTSSSISGGSTSTSVKPWHTWPTVSPTSSTSTPASVSQTASGGEKNPSTPVAASNADSKPDEDSAEEKPDKNVDPSSGVAEITTATAIIVNAGSDDAASSSSSSSSSALPAVTPEGAIPTTETIRATVKTELEKENDEETVADIPALIPPQVSNSSEENASALPLTENVEASSTSTEQNQSQGLKKCSPGYTRDQKGRCSRIHGRRRIPTSLLPFGIRLAPKIHRYRDHQDKETLEG